MKITIEKIMLIVSLVCGVIGIVSGLISGQYWYVLIAVILSVASFRLLNHERNKDNIQHFEINKVE